MFLYLAGSHGYIYERQKRKYYLTAPAGIFCQKSTMETQTNV